MALISEFLYQHLLDWLCPAMEAEYKRLYSKGKDGGKLRGLGKYDKNVYQGRVDRLRAIVRNLICEDKMKRFLSDGSKSARRIERRVDTTTMRATIVASCRMAGSDSICLMRLMSNLWISSALPTASAR